MTHIHPSAVIDPRAELGDGVTVGPFCVVEGDVQIGNATRLDSHVTIKSGTQIGVECFVGQGAVLGGDPQDRRYQGESTYLIVGDRVMMREYVTLHRATGEGLATRIGNDCYLMAFVHVGHNAVLHEFVTLANNVGVSGYVTIEEKVTVGGMTGIHQYVRIGKFAMVGGVSRITRDCPPYMITEGIDQKVYDINAVGLRRIGISPPDRMALHKAAKILFRSELSLRHAIEAVRNEVTHTEEVAYLLAFMERLYRGKSGRGDQP